MLPVSVALKVGVVPTIGLLFTSYRTIVTVPAELPFAVTGPVPVICEVTADGAPAVNVTVPPAIVRGEAILSVFTSAWVEESEQVDVPLALVAEQVP